MHFISWYLILVILLPASTFSRDEEQETAWKNQIVFPDEEFQSWTSPAYVKFTIITKAGFDPNTVYFQDCRQYEYHYEFALEHLEPFIGMTLDEFDEVTLHSEGQQAVLGAVIIAPWAEPPINEYGIQLVRNDPYSREEIVDLFNKVKSSITADSGVTAYYFPTYEQYAVARQNRDWFRNQGVPIGSAAQWIEGNVGYSNGWSLGVLKFFAGNEIQAAFTDGKLLPEDILLTDGVPAEIPPVAGVISLSPSTPNSHVAILARAKAVPFVYLAVAEDASLARSLVGRNAYLAVSSDSYQSSYTVELFDIENLNEQEKASLLALKQDSPIKIQPMMQLGQLWADTNNLSPSDIGYFGGKASNFGILRQAIPDNSPEAMAFSFDLWNAVLNETLPSFTPMILAPGGHALFWADDDPEQGPYHVGFKLSKSGEDLALFDTDGQTLIDGLSFGPQQNDTSYGRSADGADQWQFFKNPSPGQANSQAFAGNGLVINEFMADNETTIQDPVEADEYPDWIELYNGSGDTIILNGLFLSDDFNNPTKWEIRPAVTSTTLRGEIDQRLLKYKTYPPEDMRGLSLELAAIRNLLKNPQITCFDLGLKNAVIDAIESFGFNPYEKIRFRSSTNVEDSDQFTGAGLYDSYSGCLADDLDEDDSGPCACDDSDNRESGVFEAIRKVFASFYNDNAFLERLKYGVNESDVGMALLVHNSFPDEIELANGVATMERNWDLNWTANVVSQKGAISVTNPPPNASPEEVRIEMSHSQEVMPWLVQQSSLVSLRENTVLFWESDYVGLYYLLVAAAEKFCQVTQKENPLLDFEFKKIAPEGKLIIKQIREIPQHADTEYSTPFLLGEPKSYRILQGRGSDVFTSHRLKSLWTIRPHNLWLNEDNLQNCIYKELELEYIADGKIRKIAIELPSLQEAEHTYKGPEWEFDTFALTDSWRFSDLCNPRTYTLRTEPLFQNQLPDPVVTPEDLRISIEIEYKNPVPVGNQQTTVTEGSVLYQPWEPTSQDYLETSSFDDPNTGISITTQFYVRWSMMGGTPTSVQFEQTKIEGLTVEPIILTGYFSQSVGGGSHLCPMNFIFEPALEPGISQTILDELEAQNVRFIYFTTGARECRPTEWKDTQPEIILYDFDFDIWGCSETVSNP